MRRVAGIIGLIALALVFAITNVGMNIVQAQGSPVTVTAAYDALRLRSGPGAQYDTIAALPYGTTLPALARSADSAWVAVQYGDKRGWVSVSLVTIKGDFTSLPIKDAASLQSNSPGAPTPTPRPDGGIESLTMYVSTPHVNYYRLVYYSDGLRISGFYAEPRYPGKYPALIYNRGGLEGSGALTGMELAPFAECGFVVVASQYRGGPGSEGYDQLGGDDVHDVLNLITLLKARPLVDPDRIAMFGTSRGAMMTYLALKSQSLAGTNDIKVAVTTSGLSDLIMWAAEQPALTGPVYAQHIGASVRGNPAPLIARSATYWPGLIRVPLLLLHGDADTTILVDQSRRLYRYLKALGRPVNLIVYKGDGHGLPGDAEGLPEALKWYANYIGTAKDNFDFDYHHPDIVAAYAMLKGR
ncbi:MAG TPA: prolyl oligopeptidase family serine peptidase [Aggregatilineales bacterium]|nr:prolyl oligopeptidase family serine peptidase [Aggregatilineales bacterium]